MWASLELVLGSEIEGVIEDGRGGCVGVMHLSRAYKARRLRIGSFRAWCPPALAPHVAPGEQRCARAAREQAAHKVPDGVLQSASGSGGHPARHGDGLPLPQRGGLHVLEGKGPYRIRRRLKS